MKSQKTNPMNQTPIYSKQAKTLKNLLKMDKEPLSVTYSNEKYNKNVKTPITICGALNNASANENFVINTETSICPGGSWHCGLVEAPQTKKKKMVQNVLIKGEKLYHSITSFERSQKMITPEPAGLADNILIEPLNNAKKRPDLVVFLCNPEQTCRIITLDTYWDGIPPKIQMVGALCHSTISYSIMTGSTNVTVGDWTARHHQEIDSNIMFVTIPYERLNNLIAAIPECSAGTAKIVMPEELFP